MSQYYDRRYSVDLDGEPFIVAADGPTFRCAFDISIDPGATNAYADIRFYNLSKETANKSLKRGTQLTFRAGYVETIDTLFLGTIVNTFKEREGPSTVTRVLCRGGNLADQRGTITASFGANARVLDMIKALAENIPAILTIDPKQFEDVQPYPRGYIMNGDVQTYLDTLANAHGFEYVIENGRLVINRIGYERDSGETVISRSTGMEGVPEITGGPQGVGCDVTVRLNPKLRINGKFRIESELATYNTGNMYLTEIPELEGLGTYNTLSIRHNGDTHGDTWSSRLSGVKPGKPTVGATAAGSLVYGKNVDQAFRVKVKEIASRLNVDPNWMMAIMAFETGRTFSPSAKNPVSGATGLIQFMPSTAAGLGTSTLALSRMTAVEQLDYVEAYFKPYTGRLTTLGDTYMAVLWPVAMGKADTSILWQSPSIEYRQNEGLDANYDGKITKLEAYQPVNRELIRGANYAA